MSMADVIRAIQQDMYKKAQIKSSSIDDEPVECSTLTDRPVIKINNETDKQIQK